MNRLGAARKHVGDSQKWGGTILGVSIVRTIAFWGLCRGGPYFGKLPCKNCLKHQYAVGSRGGNCIK